MGTITLNEVSGTTDGHVFCGAATWGSARAGTGAILTAVPGLGNNTTAIGTSLDAGIYYVNRTIVTFPVVSIPTGTAVIGATLVITPDLPAVTTPVNSAKVVVCTSPGPSTALNTAMFGTIGADASSPFAMSDVMAAPSGYSVTLNSDGIAAVQTTGTTPTRLMLLSSNDYGNTPPTIPDDGSDLLLTTVAPATNYTLIVTYGSAPPPVISAGSQLFYDFQRQLWFSGAYGSLQMIATDPTQGAPKIYALTSDGSLIQMLDEGVPGWPAMDGNPGTGFLQTMPLNLGNMTSRKTFHGFVMVVNDVTAITVGGAVTSPWRAFLYVDNANLTTPPIPVTLTVNAQPYNTMPYGTIEGGNAANNNIGELIGYFQDPNNNNAPPQGHNAYLEIYYPVGTPVNTPTSGVGESGPLNLPWAVYRMDVFISPMGESEVEP